MPILNYTTKIDVHQTIGEIQAVLVKHGARKIMMDYRPDGSVEAMTFAIDTPRGPRGIRMPANVEGVRCTLAAQKVKADGTQAARVAWRILLSWIEAQMAILEAGMVQMEEIFLPYMLDSAGRTMFEAYVDRTPLLEEGVSNE